MPPSSNPPECKICRSPTTGFISAGENFIYCRTCEFIYKDPSLHISPELEKKRYNQHENSITDTGYTGMLTRFFEQALLPFIGPSPTLLDFGSGPEPVFAQLLKNKGYDTDIYDKYFAPDSFYERKTYNAVSLIEVAEHLADPGTTLRRLVNRLNKGGLLAIMTLFHPGPGEAFTSWWYRQDTTHISFFNITTMRHLATSMDLKILFTNNRNTVSFRYTGE